MGNVPHTTVTADWWVFLQFKQGAFASAGNDARLLCIKCSVVAQARRSARSLPGSRSWIWRQWKNSIRRLLCNTLLPCETSSGVLLVAFCARPRLQRAPGLCTLSGRHLLAGRSRVIYLRICRQNEWAGSGARNSIDILWGLSLEAEGGGSTYTC